MGKTIAVCEYLWDTGWGIAWNVPVEKEKDDKVVMVYHHRVNIFIEAQDEARKALPDGLVKSPVTTLLLAETEEMLTLPERMQLLSEKMGDIDAAVMKAKLDCAGYEEKETA